MGLRERLAGFGAGTPSLGGEDRPAVRVRTGWGIGWVLWRLAVTTCCVFLRWVTHRGGATCGQRALVSVEIVQLVEQAGPYLSAAAGAYGVQVFGRAEDAAVGAAADATANLGRRILQAVWHRQGERGRAALASAVQDVAHEPEDVDAAGALRQQVKRALREDEDLRWELAELFAQASGSSVVASGERSIASGSNSGVQITGDDAHVTR